METWLIYVALAFVAGAVFGMTVTASALGGRPQQQQPTVIMMDTHRQPLLEETGGGCLNIIFVIMLGVGATVALLVLMGW